MRQDWLFAGRRRYQLTVYLLIFKWKSEFGREPSVRLAGSTLRTPRRKIFARSVLRKKRRTGERQVKTRPRKSRAIVSHKKLRRRQGQGWRRYTSGFARTGTVLR